MDSLRVFVSLLLLAVILSSAGCNEGTSQTAYRVNYDDAYRSALESGKARGAEAGVQQGISEAHEAAKTGRAWQLYRTLAFWAALAGCLVGIFVQYAILFVCQSNSRLPGPLTVAFVPAMKTSLSYSIFERQYRIMVDLDEQVEKVLASRNLKIAQIRAVHDAVRQRVMAASSIEELTETRLVELANLEFENIVAQSQKVSEIETGQSADKSQIRNICKCPHCGRRVQFPTKAANKAINCPYQTCGRPMTLPPLSSN